MLVSVNLLSKRRLLHGVYKGSPPKKVLLTQKNKQLKIIYLDSVQQILLKLVTLLSIFKVLKKYNSCKNIYIFRIQKYIFVMIFTFILRNIQNEKTSSKFILNGKNIFKNFNNKFILLKCTVQKAIIVYKNPKIVQLTCLTFTDVLRVLVKVS